MKPPQRRCHWREVWGRDQSRQKPGEENTWSHRRPGRLTEEREVTESPPQDREEFCTGRGLGLVYYRMSSLISKAQEGARMRSQFHI